MHSASLQPQPYGEHTDWIRYACVFHTEKFHIFFIVIREKKPNYSSTTEFIHNSTLVNSYTEVIWNLKTGGSFIPQQSITHFLFDQAHCKATPWKRSSVLEALPHLLQGNKLSSLMTPNISFVIVVWHDPSLGTTTGIIIQSTVALYFKGNHCLIEKYLHHYND